MFKMILDDLIERNKNKEEKNKSEIKLGQMCGVDVYMTPGQKDVFIKDLIETEYISKDKIRNKIKELKAQGFKDKDISIILSTLYDYNKNEVYKKSLNVG